MSSSNGASLQGRVKWFSQDRFYGFIECEGGDDVFLHGTALPEGLKTIAPDTRVTFRTEPGRNGRHKAVDVELA